MYERRALTRRDFLRLSAVSAAGAAMAACVPTPLPTPMPLAPAPPDYSSVTGELSQLIQTAVEKAGITGLSVALVDDQEIVWSKGFGYADKENGVEATPKTLYMTGSVSKLFTAAAIMQLAEQGKIDIDQPVQTVRA